MLKPGSVEERRIGPFRSPELELMRNEYRDIAFSFAEIAVQPSSMHATMTRAQFVGFVGSWSAVAAARAQAGPDPVHDPESALGPAWPDEETHLVQWPIAARAGRAN